jgi:hypothetical protein
VRIRVASNDWWASRKTVSVIWTLFSILILAGNEMNGLFV